ncbi:MAG: hypothetical protein U0230_05830 [Polyangiales bacterium]
MERDLAGRCGTCGFFLRMHTDANGVSTGECRLGCWPSPLKDTATCSSHKPIGAPFQPALRRAKVAGAPRSDRRESEPPPKIPLPQEIDIDMDQDEFRRVLREVLLEELGVGDAPIGDRWHGGELVLKPGKDGVQPKAVPLDAFFKKIVMIRDRLRVLEQKINTHDGLSTEDKVTMQQYITACYGSLTTFNVLFRDREDWFVGQSSKD